MNMPENETSNEDKEIENLMKEFEEQPDSSQVEDVNKITHILTPAIIAESLGSITEMVARWADIKEIAFTEEDKKDLTNALKPFENQLDELLKYLPYLPLGLFAAGYAMRIIGGYKQKKAEEKADKIKKAMEAAAKEERDKKRRKAKKKEKEGDKENE